MVPNRAKYHGHQRRCYRDLTLYLYKFLFTGSKRILNKLTKFKGKHLCQKVFWPVWINKIKAVFRLQNQHFVELSTIITGDTNIEVKEMFRLPYFRWRIQIPKNRIENNTSKERKPTQKELMNSGSHMGKSEIKSKIS